MEASWLLELVFYFFPVTAVTLDTNFAILGSKTYHLESCCLHFITLGTILSAWGPWEQQEGHVGVRSKIFSDFDSILGSHFESFLNSDGLNSVFFWSLFPGHFLL